MNYEMIDYPLPLTHSEFNFKVMDIQIPTLGYTNFPNRGRSKMKFEVIKLIDILEKNLLEHKSKYNLAVENYRKIVASQIKKVLNVISEGGKINLRELQFMEPVEYCKEYERLISMMKMTSDKEIELDEHRYDQLVLDNWGWKREFEQKTCMYLSDAK